MKLATVLSETAKTKAASPALWIGGEEFTYAQIAEAGARLLQALGPVSVVAVISDRSPAAYVTIWTCLARGIVYVPINPKWPMDRILRILSTAQPDAVVVGGGFDAAALPAWETGSPPVWRFIVTPAEATAATSHPGTPGAPGRSYDAAGLAYIMFTSGSTGQPKGVPIRIDSLEAYRDGMRAVAPFGDDERVLQTVELTFDLSVHDMSLCWSSGGILIVLPEASASLVARFVAKLGGTTVLMVPSAAAQAKTMRQLKPGSMPTLRNSFFCGEALPGSLVATWAEAAPGSRIFNIYGPTEATIAISSYEVDRCSIPGGALPLGRPIGEQRLALDDDGEILLSGSQLSPGYLNDQERTATAFFEREGRRWYRTGDLGALDADGRFLFRGRKDSQIKLRGYRVELGEVETALRRAAGSDLVAVTPVQEAAPGAFDRLVAFVHQDAVEDQELVAAMGQLVPIYMMPSRFLRLDDFPRNSNGKIDHLALKRIAEQS